VSFVLLLEVFVAFVLLLELSILSTPSDMVGSLSTEDGRDPRLPLSTLGVLFFSALDPLSSANPLSSELKLDALRISPK
jgi:hypothetical protein